MDALLQPPADTEPHFADSNFGNFHCMLDGEKEILEA